MRVLNSVGNLALYNSCIFVALPFKLLAFDLLGRPL